MRVLTQNLESYNLLRQQNFKRLLKLKKILLTSKKVISNKEIMFFIFKLKLKKLFHINKQIMLLFMKM